MRIWRAVGLAVPLAWCAAAALAAEEPTNEPLRLAEVIAEARERNPEIRAARERATAAAAAPRRVSAYDDPVLSYEAWNAPDLRVDRADNNIFSLSQKVPFPGKRGLAGTIARRDADVADRAAEAVELDVAADVKRAYYDLWRAHQDLFVYSREKGLVQRLARVAEQRYAVGDVGQPDVLQAQVELTRLINRVTTQTLAIDAARAELNALLSRPATGPLGIPEDPPHPRLEESAEALTELALARRPELAAQAAAVAGAEAAVDLARRQYYPDFEFKVARFVNPGRRDGLGAMAAVSIPLAYKGKYDAGVAEASARLSSARADLRRLEDAVRREVQKAFLRARTALLQHDLFVTTHIPQAEQALRVTESAYGSGSVDFLRLIESARTIEAAHLEHFEAAAEFAKARADLERIVGGELAHAEHGREPK